MSQSIDHIQAILTDSAVCSLLLTLIVALAMVFQHQPARRSVIARAGLVSLLCCPFLVAFLPMPRLNVLSLVQGSDIAGRSGAFWPAGGWFGGTAGGFEFRPDRLVGLGVLAGALCGVCSLALGFLASRRLIALSRSPSVGARTLFDELIASAGLPSPPELRVSNRAGRPILIGLFRPVIVVPAELDTPEAAASLELALLHELAHAQGCDLRFNIVAALARSMWFFLPLAWFIVRRLRLDQEYLADVHATERFGTRLGYAQSLLELADSAEHDHYPSPLPAEAKAGEIDSTGSELTSQLYQRILMLIKCPFPLESRPPRPWAICTATLLGSLTILICAISVRPTLSAATTAAGSSAVAGRSNRTVRIANLILTRPAGSRTNRPLLCRLPFALPRTFDLRFDLWSNDALLRNTRAGGVPLRPRIMGMPISDPPAWHSIRIVRDAQITSLFVDNIPIPSLGDPAAQMQNWLMIETNGFPLLRVRNIELSPL